MLSSSHSSFNTVVLNPVSGCSQVSGIARNLGPEFLRNLIQGLVYVQVSSDDAPQGELRSQVLVNGDVCSRRLPHPHHIAEPGTCYDGSKKYYNGTSWISEDDICTTCQCQVNAGDEGVWENLPPQIPDTKERTLGTRSDTSRTLWIAVIGVSLSRVVRARRRAISRGFAAPLRVIHDCGHFIPFRSRSSRIGYAVCCILNRASASNDAQNCTKRENNLRIYLSCFIVQEKIPHSLLFSGMCLWVLIAKCVCFI